MITIRVQCTVFKVKSWTEGGRQGRGGEEMKGNSGRGNKGKE